MVAIEIPVNIEKPINKVIIFRKIRKTMASTDRSVIRRAILLLFINLIFLV